MVKNSPDLMGRRVLKNYTRFEWRRCETTLETSGEDVKTTLVSSVLSTCEIAADQYIDELYLEYNYDLNQWKLGGRAQFLKFTLETGGELVKLHSF
jgi:hypothetical protein